MAMKELADISGAGDQRLIYDFTEEINKLDAKINPLTVLTNQMPKRGSIDSVNHYWYQEELDARWDVLADEPTASDTDFQCTTYGRFHKWDVVKIPETGYVAIVTTAPTASDATVTVTVINDGSDTATLGENILIMGPSIAEGSDGVDAYQGNLVQQFNYTTTLQRTFKVTREVMKNAMHGGNELERLHNKKGREFARDLEYFLWHGIRHLDTSGPITTTQAHRWNGGLLYYMKDVGGADSPDGESTDTDINGALTESAFQSWLFDAFKYTDTLYLFCGKYGLQAIDNWARGKLRMLPSDRSYGLNITEYPLAGRMAYIIDATRVLEASPSGETDYEGTIVALDLADIKFFWYVDQSVKLYTNLQTAKQSLNQREDGYQAQFTIEMGNAKRHAICDGITGVG